MGEVVYGIVFGKPKIEGDGGINPTPSYLGSCLGIDRFSDDVFYMSPSIELPCDSEPTNEPA